MNSLIATVIAVFCFLLPSPVEAQRSAAAKADRHIVALISAPTLVTYVDDGAADASVTAVADAGDARPSVRDIINLRQRAISKLVAHLDDTRLTAAKLCSYFPGGRKECVPVPVGYVCLDILMNIVRAPMIITNECGDDGLGACVETGYYFRPDAYVHHGDRFVAGPDVLRAKSNWQRAYRGGHIKYQYPGWWKRHRKGASAVKLTPPRNTPG